jgi:hypothetical protein
MCPYKTGFNTNGAGLKNIGIFLIFITNFPLFQISMNAYYFQVYVKMEDA